MVRGVEKFKEIIEQVADDTGCAAVVIEKDYYVTMIKIPENVCTLVNDVTPTFEK